MGKGTLIRSHNSQVSYRKIMAVGEQDSSTQAYTSNFKCLIQKERKEGGGLVKKRLDRRGRG